MSIIGKYNILLPKNADMEKWAVVACDQFTAEPTYWRKLAEVVGEADSALKLIYPEIYLNDNREARIKQISENMTDYLNRGIFYEVDGFVLVEREFHGQKRVGLVLSVDLEKYDWTRVKSNIRATEDTIVERLPVRIEIRKEAKIEFPHILLLIDDERKEIIESLYSGKDKLQKLYDFDLNMNGGHIRGYKVEWSEELLKKFDKLLDADRQRAKYGQNAEIMFAVGDGNHSLATAKKCWEEVKKGLSEEERETHPARFALVEVINIYAEGLNFEPIHRVIFSPNEAFLPELINGLSGDGCLKVISEKGDFFIPCPENSGECIRDVQAYLEKCIKAGLEVDYVHGEEHLRSVIAENKNAIGLVMPMFQKADLFNYVINVGNLPKKAFSVGDPEEKKYYLEGKKIK